jgi:hypothetical protein
MDTKTSGARPADCYARTMIDPKPRFPMEEFARRGDAIYEKSVRPKMTAKETGKFVAIDIETGEYAIDADELKAGRKLRKRVPDAQIWLARVGYTTARTFGGRRPPPDGS